MYKIPLSVPLLNGNEWKYVKECIDTEWVSSAGKFVDLFEQKITDFTGSKYAVACVNGTSAIHISLKLSGVKEGDEVIIPSLTFIAPVNAIKYLGADPIFMDSDNFYNIDVEKTITFIDNETFYKNGNSYNKKTKKRISAIIPVHVWGNACSLENLVEKCKERNIKIVEDASESLGTFYNSGKYKGMHTGTIGEFGCISFNGNKIITTGGGGVILTNNDKLAEKAKYLTTQAKDDPIYYLHNEIGFNFRLTNIQAALGVAQLENLLVFLNRKKYIYQQYKNKINKINGLVLSEVPKYAENNYWINLLKINTKVYSNSRDSIFKLMERNFIQTRPVWMLNHMQKPYIKCQKYKISKAKELVDNSLCLPSSIKLEDTDISSVVSIL